MIRFIIRRLLWLHPDDRVRDVPGVLHRSHRLEPCRFVQARQPTGDHGQARGVPRGQRPVRRLQRLLRGYGEWLWTLRAGPDDWPRSIKGRARGVAAAALLDLQHAPPRRHRRRSSASHRTDARHPRRTQARRLRSTPSSTRRLLPRRHPAVRLGRRAAAGLRRRSSAGCPPAASTRPGHEGFDLCLMIKHMVLPVTVVAIQTISAYTRYMRASLLDVSLVPTTCARLGPRASAESTILLPPRRAQRADPDRHRHRPSTSARCSAVSSSPRTSSTTRAWACTSCKPSTTATSPRLMPYLVIVIVVGADVQPARRPRRTPTSIRGSALTERHQPPSPTIAGCRRGRSLVEPSRASMSRRSARADGVAAVLAPPRGGRLHRHHARLAAGRHLSRRSPLATASTSRCSKISEGNNQFLSPRKIAWFGTDDIGRDIYSRLLYGIRTSLFIGLASAVLSVVIGTTVGAIAGLRGGRFDDIMMRVTDIFLAFPFLVAVIIVRAVPRAASAWIDQPIIGETDVDPVHHLPVRDLRLDGRRSPGARPGAVAEGTRVHRGRPRSRRVQPAHHRRHLLPNSIGPILVALTLSVVAAIVGESTLSFFGFGPQPGSGQHLARQARRALGTGRQAGQLVARRLPVRRARAAWRCASTSSVTVCATRSTPSSTRGTANDRSHF